MNKMNPGCRQEMSEEEFLQKANPLKIMMVINRMHRKKMEKILNKTGLHPAQHRLLMTLAENRFHSQSEIASLMEVSSATVAVSLKKLERDGYIQKRAREEDGRVNFVSLTPKGEDIVFESKEIFESADRQVVKGFSEEEMVLFRKFLRRIYSNLSELN